MTRAGCALFTRALARSQTEAAGRTISETMHRTSTFELTCRSATDDACSADEKSVFKKILDAATNESGLKFVVKENLEALSEGEWW